MLVAQAAPPPGLASDWVLGFVLLDITLILIAARLVGGLALRIGQPRVVGEIVAGVLLGPSLLGSTWLVWGNAPSFLHCDQALEVAPAGTLPSITSCIFPFQARSALGVIGQLALVLFMFLIGLEFQNRLVKGRERAIGIVSVAAVLVPSALAFLILPVLWNENFVPGFVADPPSKTAFGLFVAAMVSVTAFPVMARILQEKGLLTTSMGSIGVAAAAAVTVLMFVLLGIAQSVAADAGATDVVLRVVLAVAFVGAMLGLVRPMLAPLGPAYEGAGTLTGGMFAFVMIGLFASAFVADRIGINLIPGAFLFGVVLPAKEAMHREFWARLGDLTTIVLLPVFLAYSGLLTDFTKLSKAAIPGVIAVLTVAIVGKWAGGAVAARVGGLTWAEGNVIGVLMNCRGLLVLVVAAIAFNQGYITSELQVIGVLVALVTTAMTGPLFDRFLPSALASRSQDQSSAATRASGAETG